MGWINNIMNRILEKRSSRINIKPADPITININSILDYEGNAAKNRIWYRGDSQELSQLYKGLCQKASMYNFWAASSSPGMEMRKVHTGIPGIIVDMLSTVVLTDLNQIEFENDNDKEIWEDIAKENQLSKLLESSLKEALCIGDGAFKITYDSKISNYPIIEFYPGDQVEYNIVRGRIQEVIFKTVYEHKGQSYVLYETYGYGYIKNRLIKDGKEIVLDYLPETKGLKDYFFAGHTEDKDGETIQRGSYMLAIPLMIYRSSRYPGRGQSIFDRKIEAFDSLDEAWSQWMDALRAGRSKEYIPDNLLPRDPNTGAVLKPNTFDNRYIQTEADMREGTQNKITLDQPAIPHESYLATYCTALDLALQGLISPSTIGIDVKKLDNAEAQREKEKTTLYTRNAIVEALTEDLRELVISCLNSYREINNQKITEIKPSVTFGEYANPSFESQVETVSKGKTGGIMSIEACVEELYGDSQDEEWKEKEVARLKNEQGIMELEEPAVNLEAEEFTVQGFGGQLNAGKGSEQNVQHEPERISETPTGGA